ncbi:MAG: FIST N-terminal domain-containing protein [Chloroflexota bacterium]
MSLLAAVGQARALDGRETGLQAAHQALNQLGSVPPFLGFVIASHQYEAQQVVNGVASLTGNLPLFGFSTPASLTGEGIHPHSVVVALLGATEARAEVQWLSGYTQGSRDVTQQFASLFSMNRKQPGLVFADGFNADAEQLCASVQPGTNLVGALSSGDLYSGFAYQIGGAQFGSGGLAIARLEGQVQVGVGYGHGWQPVGTRFRVTRSRGFWVRTLDGRPASESYANLFGYPVREWAFPPLNQLIRMYPIGIQRPDADLLVRSPLRVEADGSLRMNAIIPDGSDGYLLVGSLTSCRQAAQKAVQDALAGLKGARPVFALVLVDIAWQMLFEAQPGADVVAVREALGGEVPIAGGYTLGQIVPDGNGLPQFLNQHMVVVVFGAPAEKA